MSQHRMEACESLSPVGKRLFRYIEFDDQERLLAEIRKHPIGLFFIELTGGLISLVLFLVTAILALNLQNLGVFNDDSIGMFRNIIFMTGGILAAFGLIATIIAAILYRSNVVFVTDQKIAEVAYISLFNRKITQLGIGNVEDVAISQKGILARLFRFATLIVETAGEIENATFTYVPQPNTNSQLIIQAHEVYVQKYGN